MDLGLDYAGGRPGGSAIRAAGYQFVVRYLSDGGPSLPGKLLTPTEYADLQAHGIAVVANWETLADRMKSGYSAGAADATAAVAQLAKVGHPTNRPVYFSADWDATPWEQPLIDDYLHGAASVLGTSRVGIYGGYWIVKRCLDAGSAAWAWQTGAWSGGNVDPRIHIYQRIGFVTVGGVQCDVNEARKGDYGQYLASSPLVTKGTSTMHVQNLPQPAGEGLVKLFVPTGSASMGIARAWLSLGVIDGTGTVTVWVQRDTESINQWTANLVKDQRWWRELPDGTTQLTVQWKTTAPLGIGLEMLDK